MLIVIVDKQQEDHEKLCELHELVCGNGVPGYGERLRLVEREQNSQRNKKNRWLDRVGAPVLASLLTGGLFWVWTLVGG